MFPVPWRVQVEFPPNLDVSAFATGVPTEILVPPSGLSAGDETAMMVQMFPKGAHFIDEITGDVYRVVKRRYTDAAGETAALTLDREVFVEDIRLEKADAQCGAPCELAPFRLYVRTVWVFPPPVEAARSRNILVFNGTQPVVGIEVQALKVAPTN